MVNLASDVNHGPILSDMSTLKPTIERLYLDAESAVRAQRIAASVGESRAWLLSKLVAEGLKAIEANGDAVPLPLKLEVNKGEAAKAAPVRPKSKAA